MVDSRIPRVPPSAVEPTLRVNVPEEGRTVRIVSLPERLYDVQKAAILRGEVIRREGETHGLTRRIVMRATGLRQS